MAKRADHDQRFKVLLREFFAEFLWLFFPEWAARFDFTGLEWLDKELFTDPPHGEHFRLDLVARLPVRQPLTLSTAEPGDHWLALLHVEVESPDKVKVFRRRLYEYYEHLGRQYHLPVLPIALFLRVGLDGVGWDVYERYFWDRRVLRFEYPYIGLPALDAEQYVTGENILGVALAALMRVAPQRRAWLKEQALRRIHECQENDARRFLLFECVDAYLPLGGEQRDEFEDWLKNKTNRGVQSMMTIYYERRLKEGERKGKRELLQKQLEARFGPLSPEARQRLEKLTDKKLDKVALAIFKAKSLSELGLAD
jgi:hypothetical protein